jgi:hypothetical protein
MFKCSNLHRNHRLLEEVETLCAPDADGETVALEFQDRFEALSEPNADYIAKHTCALLLLLLLSLLLLLLLSLLLLLLLLLFFLLVRFQCCDWFCRLSQLVRVCALCSVLCALCSVLSVRFDLDLRTRRISTSWRWRPMRRWRTTGQSRR